MNSLSGPFAEPSQHRGMRKILHSRDDGGAHYSIFHFDVGAGNRVDPEIGMESIRMMFPDGVANEMNFVLFSTSGVHGSYTTIEEIEAGLLKYGEDFEDPEEKHDDWAGTTLTVLVVQPRIVCLRCGVIKVGLADIGYLKKLRASSLEAVSQIGMPWP